MKMQLIFIFMELFIIQSTKAIVLSPIPNFDSRENFEDSNQIETIINNRKDLINQCLLIPDSQNNQIFILSPNNGKDLIARHRRFSHTWALDRPLYAEEPKWILIEKDPILKSKKKNGFLALEEPFYIARGKRLQKYLKNRQFYNPDRNIPPSTNFRQLEEMIEGDSNLHKATDKKITINPNYLEPKSKHSDILGLLQEPFFISRGKKNTNEQVKNTKHKFSDYDDSSLRDRRGEDFLEQLFKENDPFYVTRGKKYDQSQTQ